MGGVTDSTGAGTRVRLEAVVRGRVQGVGFRVWVVRRAASLHLDGWVANERDGSVRTVAEGSEPAVNEFLKALRDGPPAALVERVDEQWLVAGMRFVV